MTTSETLKQMHDERWLDTSQALAHERPYYEERKAELAALTEALRALEQEPTLLANLDAAQTQAKDNEKAAQIVYAELKECNRLLGLAEQRAEQAEAEVKRLREKYETTKIQELNSTRNGL